MDFVGGFFVNSVCRVVVAKALYHLKRYNV